MQVECYVAIELEIGWIHLQGKGHQELMEQLKVNEARKDPPLEASEGAWAGKHFDFISVF